MEKKLYNVMESIVFTKLSTIINDINCCKCDECILDLVALTLNNLPPKYVASSKGEIMIKVLYQSQLDNTSIIKAIVHSSELISKKPNHSISTPVTHISQQHIKELYNTIFYSKTININ